MGSDRVGPIVFIIQSPMPIFLSPDHRTYSASSSRITMADEKRHFYPESSLFAFPSYPTRLFRISSCHRTLSHSNGVLIIHMKQGA